MPQERDDIIRSAMAWRQEKARRSEGERPEEPPPHPGPNGDQPPEPFALEPASLLANGAVPARSFLDSAGMMPLRNVVLLGGDGGTGKSLLALQLALACTTGSKWIGLDVDQGPVVYFSAEDDRDEIKRRLREIAGAEGVDLGEAHMLYPVYRVGKEAALAIEDRGRMVPTRLYWRLRRTLEDAMPVLLVLDNLADVFAGNENNRTLAKQFIGLLRGLSLDFDCVVLLLGHPSLTGLISGTGTSGSTAWSNSVRARGYLARPEGTEADTPERVLTIMKANYGPAGTRLQLSWKHHRFVRNEATAATSRATETDLLQVQELFASGQWRIDTRSDDWGGFAVAGVLGLDVGKGLRQDDRSAEQRRNRVVVTNLLNGWVQALAIGIEERPDSHRHPVRYYVPGTARAETYRDKRMARED